MRQGKLVWKIDMEDQVRCLATIAGNRGYFATCGAMLYTLDLDKGTSLSKDADRLAHRLRRGLG